jgi:hypothetical protein
MTSSRFYGARVHTLIPWVTFRSASSPLHQNFVMVNAVGNHFVRRGKRRAKVIVKPKLHQNIEVHGNIFILILPKERFIFIPILPISWNGSWLLFEGVTLRYRRRNPSSFNWKSSGSTIWKGAFKSDADGNFTMQYDRQLEDWFQYDWTRTFQQGQQPGQSSSSDKCHSKRLKNVSDNHALPTFMPA